MTDVLPPEPSMPSYEKQDILSAAAKNRNSLFTPSVLDRAADALSAVRKVLDEHEIADCFPIQAYSDSFASNILHAYEMRLAWESAHPEEDIDPVALLDIAVTAAASHLVRPLEPLDGPALAPKGRAIFGYVVLPYQPESPDGEPADDRPLVLSLGREDLHQLEVAFSSGAGWDGPYKPGPWSWHLGHEIPRNTCIGATQIVAATPAPEVAAEVGAIVAQVLTGEAPLRR
jgi:hypothetical protein